MSLSSQKQQRLRPRRKESANTKSIPTGAFKPPRPTLKDLLEDCEQSQAMEESLDKTTTIQVSGSTSSTEDLASESCDSEEDYRFHTQSMMTKYGLEFTKAIFNIEAMKCKKPKLERK